MFHIAWKLMLILRKVFAIYGSIGFGTEQGTSRIAEFLSVRMGTSPDSERSNFLHVVSSVVIQRTAAAINRCLLHCIHIPPRVG